MSEFGEIPIIRKTGEECLHAGEPKISVRLIDFWRWADSDLLNNAARGVFAEFLVATTLNAANNVRTEWLPYDLKLSSGITVEIKSAAYLQTWKQTMLSKIRFDIKPKKAWDPATNEFSDKSQRNANVYVFCLLADLTSLAMATNEER